jgi:hypothetical protein
VGWRVPCDPVQYVVMFVILAIELGAFFSIDIGFGGEGPALPWIWGALTASLITLGAGFGDRQVRAAVRGRSDAERQAVRQSLRTGVLPSDASSDAYVEWAIQLIGHKSHQLEPVWSWLPAVVAFASLTAALVSGEALWLPIAAVSAGQSALHQWDLAQMDACFANLEPQLASRLPA